MLETSKLQDQILTIEKQKEDAIKQITLVYDQLIKQYKKQCTHKWDNGEDATIEWRQGYNDYLTVCEICGYALERKSY